MGPFFETESWTEGVRVREREREILVAEELGRI